VTEGRGRGIREGETKTGRDRMTVFRLDGAGKHIGNAWLGPQPPFHLRSHDLIWRLRPRSPQWRRE